MVGISLRNMDTPSDTTSRCQLLVDNYGYIPQAVPLSGWMTALTPNKARFFHSFYAMDGAPDLVGDGFELAKHPMIHAAKLEMRADLKDGECTMTTEELFKAIDLLEGSTLKSDEPPST